MSMRVWSIRPLPELYLACAVAVVLSSCSSDKSQPPNGHGDATKVVSTTGDIIKGEMGKAASITFAAQDNSNNNVPDQQIQLAVLDGDGTLSSTNITTDSTGEGTCTYTFDGARGDGLIRAILTGKDTIMVRVRANTLITGGSGLSDKFLDIIAIDGAPASVDIFPGVSGQENTAYLNYEAAMGFVPVVYRDANENAPRDTSSILALIVNTVFSGKTADSIGIGSSFNADIRAAWGDPDTLFTDPDFSTDFIVWYASRGAELHANRSDSVVFEIHLMPPPTLKAAAAGARVPYLPPFKKLRQAL